MIKNFIVVIKPGDKLPLFTLKDQDGDLYSLESLVGKKNLIVYFYPIDETA